MKKDYTSEVNAIKSEVIREIKDILIAHDKKAADFSMDRCNCPVAIAVPFNDEETYIVDRVMLRTNPRVGKEWIEVDYSNSHANDWNWAGNLDVELLIDILETIERYGDELFEEFGDE